MNPDPMTSADAVMLSIAFETDCRELLRDGWTVEELRGHIRRFVSRLRSRNQNPAVKPTKQITTGKQLHGNRITKPRR